MYSSDTSSATTFWHRKSVVVTGGSGFLGSYVVKQLQNRGAGRIFVPRSRDYDLRGKGSVIQQLFGFKAWTLVEEGLRRTVGWYRQIREPAPEVGVR
jgi:nucleoside-diphosphate-sugar epimerase